MCLSDLEILTFVKITTSGIAMNSPPFFLGGEGEYFYEPKKNYQQIEVSREYKECGPEAHIIFLNLKLNAVGGLLGGLILATFLKRTQQ